jgi:hypothetical protein
MRRHIFLQVVKDFHESMTETFTLLVPLVSVLPNQNRTPGGLDEQIPYMHYASDFSRNLYLWFYLAGMASQIPVQWRIKWCYLHTMRKRSEGTRPGRPEAGEDPYRSGTPERPARCCRWSPPTSCSPADAADDDPLSSSGSPPLLTAIADDLAVKSVACFIRSFTAVQAAY